MRPVSYDTPSLRAARLLLAVVALTACSSSLVACGATTRARSTSSNGLTVSHGEVALVPPPEGGGVGWWASASASGGGGSETGLVDLSGENPIVAEGWGGSGPPPLTVGWALTLGDVTAVSVRGGPPIPTSAEPALPDGLRGVIVERSGGLASGFLASRFTPLDKQGNPIPEVNARQRTQLGPHLQARWWQRPERPASGACSIESEGLTGLSAQWGHVVRRLKSFPGIFDHGFITCVDTEYYLHNWPLTARLLLDASHVGAEPVAIPGMYPLRGRAGIFEGPGPSGEMVARRIHGAWLVVGGGNGLQQRVEVVGHLNASIDL